MTSIPSPMMAMPEPKPNDGFHWTQTPWGPALLCTALEPHAQHLFTIGNLALRGDEAEWRAVAEHLGVNRERLRLISQVHGDSIAVVRGGGPRAWVPPPADGVVTEEKGVAVAVRVADCAPVLIADATRPAVAAVHAGWRGTRQAIAGAAVRTLNREFGCRPQDLVAAIGPCLGPCCGEMGDEVLDTFRLDGYEETTLTRWFERRPSGRLHFDLWGANRDQLVSEGVPPEGIAIAGLCTRCFPGVFHSYRAAGAESGRMLAMIRPRG